MTETTSAVYEPSEIAKRLTNKVWLSRDQAESLAKDFDKALQEASCSTKFDHNNTHIVRVLNDVLKFIRDPELRLDAGYAVGVAFDVGKLRDALSKSDFHTGVKDHRPTCSFKGPWAPCSCPTTKPTSSDKPA